MMESPLISEGLSSLIVFGSTDSAGMFIDVYFGYSPGFAYKPQSPANAPWDYADFAPNSGEVPGYSEYTDYSTAPNESPQSIPH
jgi:hypothetical protein